MSSSLKQKTVHALSWSMVQEVAQRVLQLAVSIIMARLLLPEQFGLVAMLTVFIAVSQTLLDSGFGTALIQKKASTHLEQSSIFWLNVSLGLLLTVGLYALAPLIARFYDQPQLVSLTRAMSVVLLVNGFVVVHTALLVRRLDFKRQTIISSAGTLLGGVLGVLLAWRGFGVWSLVVQQLVGSGVRAALFWIMADWRPTFGFRLSALRGMFKFGSRMAASGLLNNIFENLYPLIIGKLFSAASLGYFTRAQTLQSVPAQGLSSIVARVTFPLFSHIQDDQARLRRGLRKAILLLTFLQFPMMIGLAAVAQPLVEVLLTHKWIAIVPYLQLLCFTGMLYPVHLLNLHVLVATGRSDLFFRLEVAKKALTLVNIFVTYRWGIMAMIIGLVICDAVCYFINTFYSKRCVGYSTLRQLRDMVPTFMISAIMGLTVAHVTLPGVSTWVQLVLKVVLGFAVYAVLAVSFRLQAFSELAEVAADSLSRSKPAGLQGVQPHVPLG